MLRNTDEYLPDSMDQFADCLPAVVDGDDDRVVDAVRPHGFSLGALEDYSVSKTVAVGVGIDSVPER